MIKFIFFILLFRLLIILKKVQIKEILLVYIMHLN